MKRPNFFDRIWKDLKRKEFIPLKILYFLVYGGMMSLFPFLSIQARSLGIEEQEIGSINGVLPILGILASSISGIIADKIGNFKAYLSITMIISGLSSLLYLAAPVGRVTHQLPEILPLYLNCSLTNPKMGVVEPYICDYSTTFNLTAYVTSCKLRCSHERNTSLNKWNLKNSKFCPLIDGCDLYDDQDFLLKGLHNRLKLSQEDLYEHHQIPITQSSVYPIIPVRMQLVNRSSDEIEMKLLSNYCPPMTKNDESSSSEEDQEEECWLECEAEIARRDMCSNEFSVEIFDPFLTISVYVLVRIIHFISLVTSIPLFEGATMSILNEQGGDVGLQRLYSNIGQVALTPLSGALIDAFSSAGVSNFRPAFYLYCVINIISAICICFIDLEFKKPAKNITEELKKLLTRFEVMVFIFVGFVCGMAFGVIDTFLFWSLENMGASKSLMGLTITVGCVFGIPVMVFATPIIDKIGHINTLVIGVLFLVIRLLGYSLISNPWWVMPFEAMESLTTSLYIVAQVSYATSLSTPSTSVFLQSLTMGFLHGVGRGVGSLISGFITKSVGLRVTFQIMAIFCGVVGLSYFLLNVIFFRKTEKERIKRKKIEDKLKEDKLGIKCQFEKKLKIENSKEGEYKLSSKGILAVEKGEGF